MTLLATISRHACFGGVLGYYQHPSRTNHCDMRFAVYSPPQAANGPVPVIYYLAGLTCTDGCASKKFRGASSAASLK